MSANHLTISLTEFRIRIARECRDAAAMTPQFPQISRSMQIIIPPLTFFQREWMTFWTDYRRSRALVNYNDTFCDLVAATAANECNWIAGRRTARTGQDATAALFEARIEIHQAPFMGIVHSKHCTCLFAYTTAGGTSAAAEPAYHLAFWEPQQTGDQFLYCPFQSALKRIDLYDVLL